MFYRFEQKQPFVQFANKTITARRAADDGSGSEVKGTVQKLKGNSGYGEAYHLLTFGCWFHNKCGCWLHIFFLGRWNIYMFIALHRQVGAGPSKVHEIIPCGH